MRGILAKQKGSAGPQTEDALKGSWERERHRGKYDFWAKEKSNSREQQRQRAERQAEQNVKEKAKQGIRTCLIGVSKQESYGDQSKNTKLHNDESKEKDLRFCGSKTELE